MEPASPGRLAANWTPKLDFTDQTLVYGSFAHGYKAGGANPPGAVLLRLWHRARRQAAFPIHPLTFKPEFIDAYELGTQEHVARWRVDAERRCLLLQLHGLSDFARSWIAPRSICNFNATVKGAELEAMYEPLPGLKFNFAGGYEDTRIDNGQSSVDLMDRTAGHPGWMVLKPFVTQPSNCIFPDYVVAAMLATDDGEGNPAVSACGLAYVAGYDPVITAKLYDPITSICGAMTTRSRRHMRIPTSVPMAIL